MQFSLFQPIKVLFEQGASAEIGTLLKAAGYSRAFLVYDKGVAQAGIVDKITASLTSAGVAFVLYDKVLPDPPASVVREGAALCRDSGCDCIVAVGGGSAIDTGKGISVLRFNPGDILDYADPAVPMAPCRGLIAVPTTSGTGSELSNGIIITDDASGRKTAILAANAMCEYAVLDPALTWGLPPALTVTTGLDVFAHAFEAYTSVLSNGATDLICEKLMETLVQYLPQALADSGNAQAREAMLAAASLGGWMLANASAHLGHAIAHVLGGRFYLVHGAACAYGLPAVIAYLSDVSGAKLKTTGRILGAEFDGTEDSGQIATKTIAAFERFVYDTLGLRRLEHGNIALENADAIATEIIQEPLAALCPRAVSHQDAMALLKVVCEV